MSWQGYTTVGDLKEMFKDFDDDTPIVIDRGNQDISGRPIYESIEVVFGTASWHPGKKRISKLLIHHPVSKQEEREICERDIFGVRID